MAKFNRINHINTTYMSAFLPFVDKLIANSKNFRGMREKPHGVISNNFAGSYV
jgi:hypothetical protein